MRFSVGAAWRASRVAAVGALLLGTAACQTVTVENAAGTPTTYQDVNSPGAVQGVGIEAQDIVSMTDVMMRDMMSNPQLANRQPSPRVILDSQYFQNQSAQRLNLNTVVDRLRSGLLRAANGRMLFVSREAAEMVEKERQLKRTGATDVGTTGLTEAQAGADFRLTGRITSTEARRSDGVIDRYNLITFEMIDLENGLIVWSNFYEFRKGAQDDVVYQ
jgi:hypothetical protein